MQTTLLFSSPQLPTYKYKLTSPCDVAQCLQRHIVEGQKVIRSFKAIINDHMSVSHNFTSHFLKVTNCHDQFVRTMIVIHDSNRRYMTITVMNASAEGFCNQ